MHSPGLEKEKSNMVRGAYKGPSEPERGEVSSSAKGRPSLDQLREKSYTAVMMGGWANPG